MFCVPVVSSWADIVKFGQARSHLEGGTRTKAAKPKAAKQTKVTKLKVVMQHVVAIIVSTCMMGYR